MAIASRIDNLEPCFDPDPLSALAEFDMIYALPINFFAFLENIFTQVKSFITIISWI
jgi:hypothetical protein